jgi:ATP-dependent DNA helicase RecQ
LRGLLCRRDDITKSLRLSNPHIAVSSFDRPNLFYSAKPMDLGVDEEIIAALKEDIKRGSSTIIYCPDINDVVLMMDVLKGACQQQNLPFVSFVFIANSAI